MRIIFLGTSGSMPTPERGSASVAVRRKGEVILMDCGEGTQRRMVEARIGFRRSMHILISHLHGDHILGLPGLLQTMTLLRRERDLDIYGPEGLVDFLTCICKTIGRPGFTVRIHEIQRPEIIHSNLEYQIKAIEADHNMDAWSYALEERPRPGRFHPERANELGVPEGYLWKRLQHGEDIRLSNGRVVKSEEVVDPPRRGRKIVYSGDTRPSYDLEKLAEGADVLIHEATFDDALEERAEEDGHSTARQAAILARRAGAHKLFLTHISSRYPDPSILLEQAQEVFPDTIIAKDLMEVEVQLID
ncbi:MAG: ribonuclease Z [Candidatus Bathyarchaeia archaeon]